jgi:hypothetical protein
MDPFGSRPRPVVVYWRIECHNTTCEFTMPLKKTVANCPTNGGHHGSRESHVITLLHALSVHSMFHFVCPQQQRALQMTTLRR